MPEKPYYVKTEMSGTESSRQGSVLSFIHLGRPNLGESSRKSWVECIFPLHFWLFLQLCNLGNLVPSNNICKMAVHLFLPPVSQLHEASYDIKQQRQKCSLNSLKKQHGNMLTPCDPVILLLEIHPKNKTIGNMLWGKCISPVLFQIVKLGKQFKSLIIQEKDQ